MPGTTTEFREPPAGYHFPPRPAFLVIPFALAAATVAGVAWRAPVALWYVIPTLAVVLAVGAILNAGLVVSREGIEWYALRPRWRFRRVPWRAVRDVRRSLFGLGNRINLVVEPGRYEPWVWGEPRRGRRTVIQVWPTHLIGGEGLWSAVQELRPAGGPTAREPAGPDTA